MAAHGIGNARFVTERLSFVAGVHFPDTGAPRVPCGTVGNIKMLLSDV